MTEWLLPIVIIYFVSMSISYRLRNSLIDGDFAALHYPGYFRAKGLISADTFRKELIGDLGNKTFVQYLNYYLYKILGSEVSKVRQFYGLWAATTGALLFVLIGYLTGDAISGLLGGLSFTAWAHHPQMFAHYESAERFALFHSLLHLGCVLVAVHSHSPLWAIAAAFIFMPMPFLHKPVYFLEAPIAFSVLLLWGPPWSVICYIMTMITGLGILFVIIDSRIKNQIFAPLINLQSGFFVYALGHFKNLSRGLILKKLRHYSFQIIPRLFLPAIPAFLVLLQEPKHPEILSVLIFMLGALVLILCQMRFHPYQYLPLILPLSMFMGLAWQWSLLSWTKPLQLIALLALYGDLILFLRLMPTNLNQRIWSSAPHYLNRNEAAPYVAKILKARTKQNEPVLVWGDTPQIYLYADRPSSYPYLEIFPEVFSQYPNKRHLFFKYISEKPPGYIAVMMNNVNWQALYEQTGLRYRQIDAVHCHDEWFPIYGIDDRQPYGFVDQRRTNIEEQFSSSSLQGVGQTPQSLLFSTNLFIECLCPTENRKIFNPMRSKENTDPNPTVWNPEMYQ